MEKFLDSVEDTKKRNDAYLILDLMKKVTGEEARMWGASIVGFGSYRYKYPSGQEGDWMKTGFSPRKQNLTIYILTGFERYEHLMKKLGTFKTGKSCLYIKKIEDIDQNILGEIIGRSVDHLSKK